MEPEGSLRHSQVPVSYTYPEPAQSSQNKSDYILNIYIYIYST